jgi:hypothetical protein
MKVKSAISVKLQNMKFKYLNNFTHLILCFLHLGLVTNSFVQEKGLLNLVLG